MIRPELSDELVNEVRLLSGNTIVSFEDALQILVDKYKKLKGMKK